MKIYGFASLCHYKFWILDFGFWIVGIAALWLYFKSDRIP
ncbi:hypothetical protein D1AOALGA4SA_10190 [Olavius algarvensis Delta 1 endosymbiont]|nr:hypothetical protein D1AOALGA4SA_10190 [Olavius algarvensis Delta 1 endosymbiont]